MKNFTVSSIGLCLLLLLSQSFSANAQISVYPIQDFNFGTFYHGNAGGTITVYTDGLRSSTGDIVLLNSNVSVSQAIFDIDAPADAVISISSLNSTLNRTEGGSMALEITGSNPASPFINKAVATERTRISFSGRLIVGDAAANPPGIYQGTFSVTFSYQ